jgi:hypothetical protein
MLSRKIPLQHTLHVLLINLRNKLVQYLSPYKTRKKKELAPQDERLCGCPSRRRNPERSEGSLIAKMNINELAPGRTRTYEPFEPSYLRRRSAALNSTTSSFGGSEFCLGID